MLPAYKRNRKAVLRTLVIIKFKISFQLPKYW